MPSFTPTNDQRAVIEHPLSGLLVVAGAGTGKTTVVAARMLDLVHRCLAEPHQILGLTFTNKAAANLKDRVRERLGADADVTVSTYHAFGAALVAAHGLELGLDPGTQVLNRAQAWQLLFSVFDEFRFQRRSTFVPSLVVNDALALASHCADHLVKVEEVVADCEEVMATGRWQRQRETAANRLELCQVVSAYERRKRERNLLDYGDQVALAVRLLRQEPELASALHRRHPVALLDEYQDTNYAQRVLLQYIYPPGSAVTAVGDDMQSIYAFRGAHLGNIFSFADHFPPAERMPLETNRRSGPELVELANRIQAKVPAALPKRLAALPGADSTTIECFLAADDAEEAAEVARQVRDLGPPWVRHAVLCRKRRLIGTVAAALELEGLPTDVVGAGGLLDRPEIVDLVSWLEVLADLSSSVALLRLLQGPRYRLGWRDLAALARRAHELRASGRERLELADVLEELDTVTGLSPAARGRLEAFCRERRSLSAMAARLSVLDLAEAVTQQTGLWSAAGEKGRQNLLRFYDLAARFDPVAGDPGLLAFVEYLQLLDETDEELAEAHGTGEDAVRVMTVHQAKGLEFDCVWVPGLAGGSGRGGGIFPESRAGDNPLSRASTLPWWVRPDDDGMPHWRKASTEAAITAEVRRRRSDEEWRLFYVACTRARRRLVCSAAHWYPGPAEPQGPSEFYEFVAAQADLVNELFRHDPPSLDPATAAKERRRTSATPSGAAPIEVDDDAIAVGFTHRRSLRAAQPRPVPTTFSVTDLVTYARCPLQYYWSAVRPLPRPPSAAARLGIEVHEWIEDRIEPTAGVRQAEIAERRGFPDAGAAHDPGSGGDVPSPAALQASFLTSPYAGAAPIAVEAPFELVIGSRLIRGRVDAVYRRDGRTELVDWKTGLRPVPGDGGAGVQLALYALAAVEAWDEDPDQLRTTNCYLRADGPAEPDTRTWNAERVGVVRSSLVGWLEGVSTRRFHATPGDWCARCDFLAFCQAGQSVASGDSQVSH
ncbi:MAG: ATP-dependent helicase [Actinomycetota bacterium]|nr:ATP-dependent helicase [Actinomycetota bacterium]